MKRPAEQRRKLPPEFEAFARGDEEKLRIRRPRVDRGLIRDPREGYTIAGVSNRDARAVYDVRANAMRALWDNGAADDDAQHALGQLFHDVLRLELWHARRLTSFAAFAEEVVGVPVDQAEALADAAALRTGEPVTPLTEVAIALWLRTEAGLYEGDESARCRIRSGNGGLVLELSVDLREASTALAGVGARHLPLARSGGHERGNERDDERGRGDARGRGRGDARERGRDDESDEPLDAAAEVTADGDLPARLDAELGAEPSEGFEASLAEDDADLGGSDDAVGESTREPDDSTATRPAASAQGARLLTRKAQPAPGLPARDARPARDERAPRDERPRDAAPVRDHGERWGRREPRDERPGFGGQREAPRAAGRGDGPRDRNRDERPRFGQERQGGDRPRVDRGAAPGQRSGFGQERAGGERASRFGGPRAGANDERAGGQARFDRGAGRDERPRFGQSSLARGGAARFDDRQAGGDRGPSPRGDRPRGDRPQGGKPPFGQGGGKFGGGFKQGERAGGFKQGGFTQGERAGGFKQAGGKFGGERERGGQVGGKREPSFGARGEQGRGFGARQAVTDKPSRFEPGAKPRRDDVDDE